ncbi:unnamed protein product [Closterium sp. NIES-65]|nr:unnamed protein product [Closterium sp. NIES-65]
MWADGLCRLRDCVRSPLFHTVLRRLKTPRFRTVSTSFPHPTPHRHSLSPLPTAAPHRSPPFSTNIRYLLVWQEAEGKRGGSRVHETWLDGIEELRSCIMEKCPEGGKSKLQQDLDEAYHLVEQRIEEHMEAFKTRALATAFALPPSLQAHLATLDWEQRAAAPAGSNVGAGGGDDLAAEASALDAELAELNATLEKKRAELRAMRRQQRQQLAAVGSEGQLKQLQQIMQADHSELLASHDRLQAQQHTAMDMTGDRVPASEEGGGTEEGVAVYAAAQGALSAVQEHMGKQVENGGSA